MKKSLLLILPVLFLLLNGCYVENTAPEKDKTLIIASDYLEEGDSLVFEDFAKKTGVRIIIKHLDASTIDSTIKTNQYAHGIDLVLLRSLYSVGNVHQSNLFHSVDQFKTKFKDQEEYISEKYNFIGIGIDPFICVSRPDSNVSINNYNDLKYTSFINLLDDEDFVPMFSTFMSKMDKVQCYEWTKAVLNKSKKIEDVNRYQAKSIPVILTTFENYSTKFQNDSILQKYTILGYPNSSTSGTFYNLRTACIAGQAQHFTEAVSFIEFYMSEDNNKNLNARLHTLSVFRDQDDSRLYHIDSKDVIQYYKSFLRILSRLT